MLKICNLWFILYNIFIYIYQYVEQQNVDGVGDCNIFPKTRKTIDIDILNNVFSKNIEIISICLVNNNIRFFLLFFTNYPSIIQNSVLFIKFYDFWKYLANISARKLCKLHKCSQAFACIMYKFNSTHSYWIFGIYVFWMWVDGWIISIF